MKSEIANQKLKLKRTDRHFRMQHKQITLVKQIKQEGLQQKIRSSITTQVIASQVEKIAIVVGQVRVDGSSLVRSRWTAFSQMKIKIKKMDFQTHLPLSLLNSYNQTLACCVVTLSMCYALQLNTIARNVARWSAKIAVDRDVVFHRWMRQSTEFVTSVMPSFQITYLKRCS